MTFAEIRHHLSRFAALCVLVALVMLSFGHRVYAEHQTLDPATLAFLEAGGQLSDICDIDTGDPAHVTDCPVCTLAHTFALPDTAGAFVITAPRFSIAQADFGDAHDVVVRFDHSRTSRAPPRA